MQKITPFLWFKDNNAEEAMNFYTSIFPNSKIVEIKRYPEGSKGPAEGFDGKVLTGIFELEGQQFMCLDGGPGVFEPTGAISFLVQCETQEDIDHYWSKLSADPASEQCGWLKDKYGFSWQITPDMTKWFDQGPNKEGAARAMQAMLQMKKIVIADLERAYNGN